MMAARTVLLLVLLVHVLAAAAARPLEGRAAAGTTAAGVWLESGIGMVTELLRAAKSGPNPRTHCC
ncbi:hypothetical protein PAHAL_7G111300 [Panicum hallii]|uniref:Uncharacterized protein n=1 Tax=Panicum hallii TaxID=206008 RepID=A0A2S3I5L2_9POAL|nr:hypothetical protein PAHAL_7G111300 [Panicum hallii]